MAVADEPEIVQLFDTARATRNHTKKFKKFSSGNPKDNFVLTQEIAKQKIRIAQVAAHKPSMEGTWLRANHRNEYNYLMKFILERISWISRDAARGNKGDEHKCRLVFSEQSMYPYDDFADYLRRLKKNRTHNCRIEWDYIELPTVLYRSPHVNETPLHIADIVASALHKAIEPKDHGMVDERFQLNLSPVLYRKYGVLYGVKLFPSLEIARMSDAGSFRFLKLLS